MESFGFPTKVGTSRAYPTPLLVVTRLPDTWDSHRLNILHGRPFPTTTSYIQFVEEQIECSYPTI